MGQRRNQNETLKLQWQLNVKTLQSKPLIEKNEEGS